MANNWIRDVAFNRGSFEDRGYMPAMWLMAYHMLRCVGYQWIWECDGHRGVLTGEVANHVADGNMELAGTADWTPAGGSPPTVSKNTSTFYSGSQSLEVAGQLGGEVQSSLITNPPQAKASNGGFADLGGGTFRFTKFVGDHDFSAKNVGDTITFSGCEDAGNNGTYTITSIISVDVVQYTNGGGVANGNDTSVSWYLDTPIHLAIWVNNTGSQSWNVNVDRGDGTPVTVGSFSGTVGWEIKHFDFRMAGNGNVQVILEPQGTLDTIYVDGMLMFRSFFEFTGDFEDYADGDTGGYVAQTVSNEFESSNYTFVAGDVGKFLVLFDASGNYPKNTGCYAITGINAGKAVLDLRSPTASLTSQNGAVDALNWRMVDIYKWMADVGLHSQAGNRVEVFDGFGLESPHSSKWRFVLRGLWTDNDVSNNNGLVHWSAPEDTDIDIDTGNFFLAAGPSIQGPGSGRNKTLQDMNFGASSTIYGDTGINGNMNWMRSRPGSATYTSRQIMLFDDEGAWFFLAAYPDTASGTAGLFGIVGQDLYHPGVEAHCHISSRTGNLSGGTTRDFLSYARTDGWWRVGKGIAPSGEPVTVGCGQYGLSSGNDFIWELSNAQPNPFSGDEMLQPFLLVRGGTSEGFWSEREVDGFYQGRANMTAMTTFGNINGLGDSLSYNPVGDVVTLSDAAGLFTANMVGKEVTIIGSPTANNDGTFVVTGQTATTLTWVNALGASEAAPAMTWSVNMAQFLHIKNGLCIDWMEERIN